MEPVIQVRDLRKAYKTYQRKGGVWSALKSVFSRRYEVKEALRGISFDVQKGEVVGFIGPNGAGKSTTIKALSGVLVPSSGSVRVLGSVPWEDRVRYVKHIGVVFGQKEQLYWDLPAMDTYLMYREVYEIPTGVFWRRLRRMIRLLEMEAIVKVPVRDLSLGERMKCKLVAALLHRPELVFLDEPTIGLDVVAKETMREFIREMNRELGTTFVITTHDMQDIEKLCKRVIIIDEGRVVFDGLLVRIRERILKRKVIEVKLERVPGRFAFPHCKVVRKAGSDLRIEVDTRRQGIKAVIDYLISRYRVEDIVISEPPIEEIIRTLYRGGKK